VASASTDSKDWPAGGGGHLRLDGVALVRREVAELHQRVDEEAQARLRRQAAGRGVRRVDEAGFLEVLHDVAHRGRRQGHGQDLRQVARTHRLAGRQIALDDLAEDLARALVELGQGGIGHGGLGERLQSLVGARDLGGQGQPPAQIWWQSRH
jgi:hypothetical protein